MGLQLLFASAVTPSLLLMWYFHSRDHHPEPRSVLLATFFLGVAIVVPVLLLAAPFDLLSASIADPYLRGVYRAFAVAAIPEELLKLLVVARYCARHPAFDEPMDGLVYGAVASLGFATLENVLYVAQGGLGLALLRALTAVPSHAFWGAIMGYYVGQAKFGPPERRAGRMWLAFLVPMVLHGLYDAPVLGLNQTVEVAAATAVEVPDAVAATLVVSLATLVISAIWALRAAGGLRREQLLLVASGGPAPSPVAASPVVVTVVTPARSPALGVALMLCGGLMVCAGGFFLLGAGLAAAGYGDQPVDTAVLAIAVGLGMIPLSLGLVSFRAGLRRV